MEICSFIRDRLFRVVWTCESDRRIQDFVCGCSKLLANVELTHTNSNIDSEKEER